MNATSFAVQGRLHCSKLTHLPFPFLSARHRPHTRSLTPGGGVENRPQRMGPIALKLGGTAGYTRRNHPPVASSLPVVLYETETSRIDLPHR